MFGLNKKELVQGLCNLRKHICNYVGPKCDCKFGISEPELGEMGRFRGGHRDEQTGCPEIGQAVALINVLTEEKFDSLCVKAGVMQIEMLTNALKGGKPKQVDLSEDDVTILKLQNQINTLVLDKCGLKHDIVTLEKAAKALVSIYNSEDLYPVWHDEAIEAEAYFKKQGER